VVCAAYAPLGATRHKSIKIKRDFRLQKDRRRERARNEHWSHTASRGKTNQKDVADSPIQIWLIAFAWLKEAVLRGFGRWSNDGHPRTNRTYNGTQGCYTVVYPTLLTQPLVSSQSEYNRHRLPRWEYTTTARCTRRHVRAADKMLARARNTGLRSFRIFVRWYPQFRPMPQPHHTASVTT